MKWVKRIFIVGGTLLVIAIVLAIAFISPITKFILEKYSKQWLGRQIAMTDLSLNFFTGSFTITGFRAFEPNEKDVFISADTLEGNFSHWKLLRHEIEFNKMKLRGSVIHISQLRNHFSFDDVVLHFSGPGNGTTAKKRKPMAYWIGNFSIDSGTVYYENKTLGRIDTFQHVNFNFPVLGSDVPITHFHVDFSPIQGGKIKADMILQMKTFNYGFHIQLDRFNLIKYYAALRSMLKVASFHGYMTGELNVTGTFKTRGAVAASGKISIDSLAIKDAEGEVFASLNQFLLDIDTINVAQNIFNFHKILFDEPYFKLDKFSNGNNLSRMLVRTKTRSYQSDSSMVGDTSSANQPLDYSNIFTLIWSYGKFIAKNFPISNYKAESILLQNGQFIYDDYSLEDRFTYDVTSLRLQSASVSSTNKQVGLSYHAVLNHYGGLNGTLRSSPDFKHMNIDYVMDKIKAPDFNAYTRHYLATPFFDGLLDYTAHITIDTGWVSSENKINIINLVAGKKIESKPVYKWPVRLTVSLLKDVHGDIALDIPIEGNLNDPNYHLGKVVWQAVENLFIKAVNVPAKLLSGIFGDNEEDLKEIPFDYLQREFEKSQYKKLNLVAKVLKQKPELNVQLTQLTDTIAEREELALHDAKLKYYTERLKTTPGDTLSEEDEEKLEDIQNKDSLFNAYLNEKLQIASSQLISTQEKSIRLIGFRQVEKELQQLLQQRNDAVLNYLITEKSIAPERVRVVNNHDPLKSTGLPEPRYLVTYWEEE